MSTRKPFATGVKQFLLLTLLLLVKNSIAMELASAGSACAQYIYSDSAGYHDDRLKGVHYALFNFILPESDAFSSTIRQARCLVRERSWEYVRQNRNILQQLEFLSVSETSLVPEDLQKSYPELMTFGFQEMSYDRQASFLMDLRRHADNDIRRLAFELRKTYISLAYSSKLPDGKSLSELISGIDTATAVSKEVDYLLPDSKLTFDNGVIRHQSGEIDYLVIGSGPAGSLIASELARSGTELNIVVVEAGPFVKPGSRDTTFTPELIESANLRTSSDGSIVIRNGQAVGGGTAVNVDLAFSPRLPAIERRFHQWMDNDWVREDLFNDSRVDAAYQWVMQKLGTRKPAMDEVNQNNRILHNGALEEGLVPERYHLNARTSEGGQNKILKVSAVDAFLNPSLRGDYHNRVSIIPSARVTRVLMDGSGQKAEGVQITFQPTWDDCGVLKGPNEFAAETGTVATIQARNVILSAGSLGSAEIMLRSFPGHPRAGKGIVLHPSMGIPANFHFPVNNHEGISASVYVPSKTVEDGYFFEAMSADAAFGALLHPGSGRQILSMVENFSHYGGFGVMLVDEPEDNNRIFINPETNEVDIFYELSDDSIKRFKEGLKIGIKIAFKASAEKVELLSSESLLSDEATYFPLLDISQVETAVNRMTLMPNQNFLSSAHLQGSNKMGNNAQTSVVSKNFRVWNQKSGQEISNLYIVDGSVFPTSCGANPMQTIYTIGKLFVDGVIKNSPVLLP
ncbi:GMC family oxidoreductase N-terminal domain-containing protein [Endozoicomonas atrinae]|uniref:GMC family oxidoreductase N-terminal domain-containing protein n=1 Tax=Endozoicomonas atrinae TaxID=1333660 RepID=UPI003AFFEFA7